MKIIRKTMYPPSKQISAPVTMVIRETDLKEGVTIQQACEGDPPEMFVINDVFDAEPDVDIAKCTFQAYQRQQEVEEDEWNMAILFYYDAMCLEKLVEHGTVANPKPAPLTADQVQYALQRLFSHKSYKHHTMITFSRDGFMVTAKDGAVTRTAFNTDMKLN